MNFILYDLEATCWEGVRGVRETIEIGAVKVDGNKQILSQFNSFIRPVKDPVLSEFCIQLTSITQQDVDRSPFFHEVIRAFKDWIVAGSNHYTLCSWGFFDPDQLVIDCKYHNLDHKWVHPLMSLKHQYAAIKGLEDTLNFRKVLEREEIDFIGKGHRAIDDARNMFILFNRYFDKWRLPTP